MGAKNVLTKSQLFSITGSIVSIISVFLPWFSASAVSMDGTSGISVNGLGSLSGSGLLLGLVGSKVDWEFQGIGILALGIICVAVTLFLHKKMQSLGIFACGILIIGGGAANLMSIGSFSGQFLGAMIQSGAGYGLYIAVLGGLIAAGGGVMSWKADIPNTDRLICSKAFELGAKAVIVHGFTGRDSLNECVKTAKR